MIYRIYLNGKLIDCAFNKQALDFKIKTKWKNYYGDKTITVQNGQYAKEEPYEVEYETTL